MFWVKPVGCSGDKRSKPKGPKGFEWFLNGFCWGFESLIIFLWVFNSLL